MVMHRQKGRESAENKYKKLIILLINAPIPTSITLGHISGATRSATHERELERNILISSFFTFCSFSLHF